MVIFHSYVKLPGGTCETWWFSTSQSVRVYQRLLKISQMVNVIFKYPPINPIKSKSPLNPNKFHFVLILPVVFFTCRNSEPRCQHQGMRLSFGWDRRVEWWCSRAKNTRVSETWGHCLTFVSIWKVIHRLHNWGPAIFRETIHKSCLKPPFRRVFFEPKIHHVAIENRQELHSLPQLVWEAYYAGTVPKGSRGETRRMASMFLKAGLCCTGIQMHQCTLRVYIYII